jgi:uncharacterized protein with GYD domain
MPTFISYVNFTDQGIRDLKNAPNRIEAARAALKNLGGELKDIYLTTGQYDVLAIVEAPDAEVMAKFALTMGQLGNVRTTTVRGFTEDEYYSIVAELP